MEPVRFGEADRYEPEEGWERVSMAGGDAATVEWFTKLPGHSSPMHEHDNEQVCLVLSGELTVHTPEESVRLGERDSVHLAGGERHRVENEGEETAVGLDVFAPGRDFGFWTD